MPIHVFVAAIFYVLSAVSHANASAPSLATLDVEATSGEPGRIRNSIEGYRKLNQGDPDVQWRLMRAYFHYYDELTDRGRRKEQQWAADQGYALAVSAYAAHKSHPEIVYYYATIGLCYLDFHRMKAVFLINGLLDAFQAARELNPQIDDAGPDRSLGILYHELPGWPLGRGDTQKSIHHLQEAVRLEPNRAANRLVLAKVLADEKRFDEGWPHVEFVRTGRFKVSSPHWHAIYMRRVEEVAAAFPQFKAEKR